MRRDHWLILALAGIFFGLLCCVSLFSRPQSRAYALARRAFWALLALGCGGLLGGPGISAAGLAAAAGLGAPGYALVLALWAM